MPRKAKEKSETQYFDSDQFDQLFRKFHDEGDVQAGNQFAEMLYTLHQHILCHGNFRGYSQEMKSELIQDSLWRMMRNGLRSFNPEKGTWFSYLSRSVFLNFYAYLKRYYQRLNRHQEWVKQSLFRVDTNGKPDLEQFISSFRTSREEDEA